MLQLPLCRSPKPRVDKMTSLHLRGTQLGQLKRVSALPQAWPQVPIWRRFSTPFYWEKRGIVLSALCRVGLVYPVYPRLVLQLIIMGPIGQDGKVRPHPVSDNSYFPPGEPGGYIGGAEYSSADHSRSRKPCTDCWAHHQGQFS